jgi:hypothetical protein
VIDEKRLVKNVRLLYNPVVLVDHDEFVLIVVDDPGEVQSFLTIYAVDYMVTGFWFPRKGPLNFTRTNRIYDVAKSMKLHFVEPLKDVQDAFYISVKINLQHEGRSRFVTKIANSDDQEIYYDGDFTIHARHKDPECRPVVTFDSW